MGTPASFGNPRCSFVALGLVVGCTLRRTAAWRKVSGCPLNGPVQDLLRPLAALGHLARLVATRAGLYGHVPDMDTLKEVVVNKRWYCTYSGLPLSRSLQTLQLADNNISSVEWLAQTYTSLANNERLSLAQGLLEEALSSGLQVDLTGTQSADGAELQRLISADVVSKTTQVTSTDSSRGYACYGLANSSVAISPAMFWPEGLCACLPGHEGRGATCTKCQRDTYNKHFNTSCSPCPSNSSSERGASSIDSCQCAVGRTAWPISSWQRGQVASMPLVGAFPAHKGAVIDTLSTTTSGLAPRSYAKPRSLLRRKTLAGFFQTPRERRPVAATRGRRSTRAWPGNGLGTLGRS